ncbi:MAG: nucleoside-diphosphate kinase [Thermoguttaceae bacterium]
MSHEQTLILLKPDAVERRLIGEIIGRLERKGFVLVAMRLIRITPELARKHYHEHVAKPFYPALEAFITGGPVVAMIWEGDGIIDSVRLLVGPTNGLQAPAGTVRGDYATSTQRNLIHASDSPESAAREIALFQPVIA